MAMYDKSGNAVQSVYNVNGKVAYPVFDVHGNSLIASVNATVTQIGTLKYHQAFCMYEGKYYSTDGSNIAEQDASFNVLRDVAINVGHGNSLQLGNNGVAYASGWDDDTVYIVDLATLTVTGTIALPVTGYTTCAVDDVAKLAYIWQRATRPNTESVYNFIVYDYENGAILRTSTTSVAFGAMQAVDFKGDFVLVLNGLGTAELPNGYRFYDKQGNIVGELLIPSKSAEEPEGVFVDRATGEILMSFVNKNVYKVDIGGVTDV